VINLDDILILNKHQVSVISLTAADDIYKIMETLRNLVTEVVHGGGSVMVWAAVSLYAIGPIITLHGQITARKYVDRFGNQVPPMIQTLFPNNNAVFQDDNAPIHSHSCNCSVTF
jgi:hypothetical protein